MNKHCALPAYAFLLPAALMYSTLLPRTNASPYLPCNCPLTYLIRGEPQHTQTHKNKPKRQR